MLVLVPEPPRPPFETWPIQVFDPRCGFLWYAHPAVLVHQTITEYGTLEMARAIHELGDLVSIHRADEIAAEGGLMQLSDWRSIRSYTREARVLMLDRRKARRPGELRRSMVAIAEDNELLRMALQTTDLMSSVTSRAPIETIDSLEEALVKHRIRPPAPGEAFPGR
jgi:hypothetical protein